MARSIIETHPHLAAEWHPTRNGDLMPSGITARSGRKVWWRDPLGHQWEAIVANRSKGTGCPFCSNRKVLDGFNDLATTNPDLAADWHPTKNGELTPADITAKSGSKVWWRCAAGHEWLAQPVNRSKGTGCPSCSRRGRSQGGNDLRSVNPGLAAEWHLTRNGDLTPALVTVGSIRKVWWRDLLGHEWEAALADRVRGSGCPYCAGKRVLPGFNDLCIVNPTLASEWHPVKNGDLTPQMVTARSSRLAWWRDAAGHEWNAVIVSRANGAGCPVCTSRSVVAGFNDLATTNSVFAAQWHPTMNGHLTPAGLTASSHTPVWWMCALGHEWQVSPNARSDNGCPVCSGKQVLRGFNDLATTRPDLAIEWHPSKNGALIPQAVTVMSGKRVWWLCPRGHEWEARIADHSFGYGCPVCSNQQVQAGFNDLSTTRPDLASRWHPTKNGDLTPQMITQKSGRRAWWLCERDHEWEATLADRSNGAGCPDCAEPGFKPGMPGHLYFLHHHVLGAFKVGITNVGTKRLAAFRANGWTVLNLERFDVGVDAQFVERVIKQWWRGELGLPAFLGSHEMSTTGGWTETVSAEALTAFECIARIRAESASRRGDAKPALQN
jgi:hypothetical protein